jgi:HD-GYP domain-containing protein (c-di-GMP phosphodiesterase class II)
MLLCSVTDIEPGMEVGAMVIHPRRPEIELLRPGVKLEEAIIRKLERLGVSELWVQHSATSDLDAAAAPSLSKARTLVFQRIKKDFTKLAFSTVSIAQVHDYRRTISDLVLELMASGRFAHLSQQLFTESDQLFTHSTNVAFLSVLVGLELNPYVVRQRRRLNPVHARDVVPLGLGAMLHDVGKTKLSPDVLRLHEMHDLPDDPQLREEYHRHPLVG